MSVPREEWEWFGHAAHLCVGRWCRFHLATKVGPWIVSTVGEYIHPRNSGSSERTEAEWLERNWPGEDVGLNRKYETMVFEAGGPCPCGCGMPIPNSWSEHGFEGYNDSASAREGHMRMCAEFAEAPAVTESGEADD